jgi:hypothetical protein
VKAEAIYAGIAQNAASPARARRFGSPSDGISTLEHMSQPRHASTCSSSTSTSASPISGARPRASPTGRSTSSRPSCGPPTARATATRSPRTRPARSAPITATAFPAGNTNLRRRAPLPPSPRPPTLNHPVASARPALGVDCPRGRSTRSPARLVVALAVAGVLAVFLLYTAVAGQLDAVARRRASSPGTRAASWPSSAPSSGRSRRFALAGGPSLRHSRHRTAKGPVVPVVYRGDSPPPLFKVGRHVVVERHVRERPRRGNGHRHEVPFEVHRDDDSALDG